MRSLETRKRLQDNWASLKRRFRMIYAVSVLDVLDNAFEQELMKTSGQERIQAVYTLSGTEDKWIPGELATLCLSRVSQLLLHALQFFEVRLVS